MRQIDDRRLTVQRDTGEYVDGDWAASRTESEIVGSVQSMSPRERERLPEGVNRPGVMIKLYTHARLSVVRPDGAAPESPPLPEYATGTVATGQGDRVVVEGVPYEVVMIDFGGGPGVSPIGGGGFGAHWIPARRIKYVLAEVRPNASP